MLYPSFKKLLVFLLLAIAVTLFPAQDWAQEKKEVSGEEKAQLAELKEKIIQLETELLEEKIEGVDRRITERTWTVTIIVGIIAFFLYFFGFKHIKKTIIKGAEEKIKPLLEDIKNKDEEIKKLLENGKQELLEFQEVAKKTLELERLGTKFKPPSETTPEEKKTIEDLAEVIKGLDVEELTADDYFWMGRQASNEGRYEEAISYYRRALERKFDQPYIIHNRLGYVFYRLHRYEEREREYREALRLKPDYPSANYNMACVYASQGQTDKALSSLEKAIHYGYNNLESLKIDEILNSIRDTKKFKELVKIVEERRK